MTESERRQRVITSTPHLSPDDVATRAFATSFRGYAESEVRSYLKRVSEELAAGRERERELTNALDELEERLRVPHPLSEQELLDALGEETARLLRSAREAGDNIRKKAEDFAARVMQEAREESERMRAEASEILGLRTEEAEARGAELVAQVEARAAELEEAAAGEVEAIVDAARRQGREMLEEAKAARERVLADLIRRRALLQAQIEELRGGRDRLLDAYRVVKRTFLDATEALAQVEARAAAERIATPPEPVDIEAAVAAEIEALDAAAVAVGAGEEASDDGETAPDAGRGLADVDTLFARIRAGHGDDGGGEPAPAATVGAGEAVGALAVESRDESVTASPSGTGTTELEVTTSDALTAGHEVPAPGARDHWRARRADVVDPLVPAAVKRAKRRAQDDQNALLDAVRRHKGRPTAAQVLSSLDDLVIAWGDVLRPAVDAVYGAGRIAADGEAALADDALRREAAEAVVLPLRERVTVAIDSGEEGDTGGMVERIGARYREWKNQSLEPALVDVLAFAWSRGVYDASGDGVVLHWIPVEEGRCADCDDNSLEPTVKGASFPTGQLHPPAHPGCRCLLAPAAGLSGLTA